MLVLVLLVLLLSGRHWERLQTSALLLLLLLAVCH